jgi:hypothetical protein
MYSYEAKEMDIEQILQNFLKNMNKKVLGNSSDDGFAELQINQKIAPFSAETNLFRCIHLKIILLFFSPLIAELLQLHKFLCNKSAMNQ